MQPTCQICEKTHHIPEREMIAIATFSKSFQVKNALFAIEKSHIIPSHVQLFSKEEVAALNKGRSTFLETETVIFHMHGIKDIVYLQLLYIESLCKEQGALTFDTMSKNHFSQQQNSLLQP